MDLVTSAESEKVEKFLYLLNPSATIVRTSHSAVDSSDLLSERRYDEAHFNKMPAWAEELTKDPHSEADEYGIEHFTIRALGRPFHAERWWDFMRDRDLFAGVLRAKGCFWLREDPHTRIDYSLVGNTGNLIVNQVWTQAGIQICYSCLCPRDLACMRCVALHSCIASSL
jgi:G3E family GTPase